MGINTVQPGEIGTFHCMIASGPVIIKEFNGVKKTILVKHGDKPADQLKWKFCGGKIIRGVSPEENAIREAKEEIGVTVKLGKQLSTLVLWNEVPESGSDVPDAVILIHYMAEIFEEPIAGEEILAMEWFDIDNLPEDCAPNVRQIINECKY